MPLLNCITDENGCLDCPALPPRPAVPAHIEIEYPIGWRGANSILMLGGDVHIDKIKAVKGSTSVVCGYKQSRSAVSLPQFISHGIQFFLVGGFQFFRAIEFGLPKTSNVLYNDDDFFEIVRMGSLVVYTRDVGSGPVPFYTSTIPLSGDVLVNACLYTSGDGIQ